MATLTIGNHDVEVGDEFLSLSPEQQAATVEEIAGQLGMSEAPQNAGAPDPKMAAFTGEVLSGDAKRSRAAQKQNEYEQMPAWQKPLVAADDIARLTADGLTFGYADKLGGKFSELTGIGPSEEERRQNTEDAGSRAGWAGTAADVAGGIASGGAVLKGGSALLKGAGAAIPGAGAVTSKVADLAARSGIYGRTAGAAAAGAGIGALDASGHDEDVARGALIGAGAGAAGNVIGEGVSKVIGRVAGAFNKKPVVPGNDELRKAADEAYGRADKAGVIIKPQAIQRLSKEINDDLADFGYTPELQPNVGKLLRHIDGLANDNITLKGVDQVRKIAGLLGKSTEPAEKALATQIIKKIDKHLDNLNPGDILTGNKTEGVKALQQGRKLWNSLRKSELVDDALERAKNNASASGSGGNLENAIRQQIKGILHSKSKRRGFTPDEVKAMSLIVRGTPVQTAARLLGKLSPQGGGLAFYGQVMGGIASGGMTAPLAAAGAGAKIAADAMTSKNASLLSELVRSGGSASALQVAPNAVQRLAQAKRGALTMPLTVGGVVLHNGAVAADPEHQ